MLLKILALSMLLTCYGCVFDVPRVIVGDQDAPDSTDFAISRHMIAYKDRGLPEDYSAILGYGDRAVPYLLVALDDETPRMRKMAVELLWLLASVESRPRLILMVKDPDLGVAYAAARNLSFAGGPDALPSVCSALRSVGEEGKMTTALLASDYGQILGDVRRSVPLGQFALKVELCSALFACDGPSESITALLIDGDLDLAWAGARYLFLHPSDSSQRQLRTLIALIYSGDPVVSIQAIEALGQSTFGPALPPLYDRAVSSAGGDAEHPIMAMHRMLSSLCVPHPSPAVAGHASMKDGEFVKWCEGHISEFGMEGFLYKDSASVVFIGRCLSIDDVLVAEVEVTEQVFGFNDIPDTTSICVMRPTFDINIGETYRFISTGYTSEAGLKQWICELVD